MNSSIIRYILGNVLKMEAIFLLLPCLAACIYQEQTGIYYLGISQFFWRSPFLVIR